MVAGKVASMGKGPKVSLIIEHDIFWWIKGSSVHGVGLTIPLISFLVGIVRIEREENIETILLLLLW